MPRPVLVLAGLLALLAGCRDAAPIRLGVVGGAVMHDAAAMAADEINAAGGVGGRRIELVLRDDRGLPDTAIAIAAELRGDPSVVAVVGHMFSSASWVAAAVYNGRTEGPGEPVLQISPSATSPQLTDAGEWTFRATPTDVDLSEALARAARSHGTSRAAILYHNDDYGRSVAISFAGAFQRAGGTVVSADPFTPAIWTRPDELDPYLIRALRNGMDGLIIGAQADAAERLITSARRLGYHGPIYGTDGLNGLQTLGGIGEGVYISQPFLPDDPDPRLQDFVTAHVARFGTPPVSSAALTYDIVHLLGAAIDAVGTDRRALRLHVSRIGSRAPAFPGVAGPIAFDENGDVRGKAAAVGVIRDGRIVTASPRIAR